MLRWLPFAETRVQPPAAVPLTQRFNKLVCQRTWKLAKDHVPVAAAGHLWRSLSCNTVFMVTHNELLFSS